MADDETGDSGISAVGNWDRAFLVAFVIAMLVGIAAYAGYYQPNKESALCATAEAQCGEKPDAAIQ